MTHAIADSVLAATHKLIQQALSGQWQDVPKTVEERRVLLDRLSAGAGPQDQAWLTALQQAMAESDAAVKMIADADPHGADRLQTPAATQTDAVQDVMDMIRYSR